MPSEKALQNEKLFRCLFDRIRKRGSILMSKEKLTKAEKKAAKAEKKAMKAAKKVAKAEKKASKAAKKAAKRGVPVSAPVTKKASVTGHPVRNLIIAAVISAALGVAFLVKPGLVYTYITYAVGGVVAAVGLVYIILYFARKQVSGEYHYEFSLGFIALLAGAYIALSSMLFGDSGLDFNFTVIVQIIGLAAVLDGMMKLQYMLDLGRMGYKKWWIVLITAVLGLALGVGMVGFLDYVTQLYYSTGIPVMTVLGAAYCLNAVLDVVATVVVGVRNRKAKKAAALAEAEQKVAALAVEPVEEEPIEEIIVEVVEEEELEIPADEEPVIEEPVVEEAAPEEVELPEPAQATAAQE